MITIDEVLCYMLIGFKDCLIVVDYKSGVGLEGAPVQNSAVLGPVTRVGGVEYSGPRLCRSKLT